MPHAPLAATTNNGNFLVSPSVGVMIWTLVAFGITMLLLWKLVFPYISAALDKRQKEIDGSITASQQLREDAQQVLEEYQERLAQAREQAEEILARAQEDAKHSARESRERNDEASREAAKRAQREIDAATRQALAQIRDEVADLTIAATEKVTRRALDPDQQRRLVQEAIDEIDFSVLAGVGEDAE